MDGQKYTLRFRSKIVMGFLFAFVGIPMLYAAYLNLQVQEFLMAGLMVVLFSAWGLVIVKAMGFHITVTDTYIQREGLFSPNKVHFSEIDTIHFGSTLSDCYVQTENTKVFVSKDFENFEQIIRHIVAKVSEGKNADEVSYTGNQENIELYATS